MSDWDKRPPNSALGKWPSTGVSGLNPALNPWWPKRQPSLSRVKCRSKRALLLRWCRQGPRMQRGHAAAYALCFGPLECIKNVGHGFRLR